ncbi:substrate-binding domain-containing protein [Rhodovarius sp.]|jgi:molybdate transport system substrate-binding protein|uniref:substrate-binding domain-containing protein n=1 Tax=Rhodovarius sp. TaxID=2972673 RepID=UPI0034A4F0BA
MRVMSTLAVAVVLRGLTPRAPVAMAVEFDPTMRLLKRIEGGERADIAILTDAGVEGLMAQGVLVPGSRRDLALSHIGMAVKAGAPRPDISTLAALQATLLAAPSIAYSGAGASGLFFAGLLERLGIAEAVNAKATIIPQGFTAALAARGEVALAIQQISELMAVEGVEILGKLPPEANTGAIFSAGLFAGADQAAAGALDWLAAAMDAPTLAAGGLERP